MIILLSCYKVLNKPTTSNLLPDIKDPSKSTQYRIHNIVLDKKKNHNKMNNLKYFLRNLMNKNISQN